MKFPEWNSERVFGWVNYQSLSRFVWPFFTFWLVFICFVSYNSYFLVRNFLILSILWQIATLFPVVELIQKLKKEESKIEREQIVGAWEQTVLGFYVISNLGIVIFLSFVAGYIR